MDVTLKAARVNKGYTQKEAATKLKISKDTVSNYERGKTFPDADVIKRIEIVYGVSYDNIIFLPK